MPTVQTYQRRVAPAALPSARVSPEATAASAGPDLSGALSLGLTASHEADVKARADANELALNVAERKLADQRIDLLQNPDTGALNKHGVNALTALPDAQTEWAKRVSDIEGTLTNDEQRQAFQRRVQGHYAQLVEQIAAHTSAEVKRADTETTKSFLDDGLNAVHAAPEKADATVTDALTRLIEFGKRQGWSPETIKAKAALHVSDIHATAISALVQRGTYESAQQAETYLAKHRDDLVGAQLDDAEKLVDAGLAEGGGMREADKILGLNQDSATLPSAGQEGGTVAPGQHPQEAAATSMLDALARAEKIADPKMRKAATAAIKEHFTNIETAKRIDRLQTFDNLAKSLETSGGRINKASPEWLKISEGEREQLLHRQEQIQYPKEHGDPDTYFHLLNLASISPESRKQFEKENILSYSGLSPRERTNLLTLQRSMSVGEQHKSEAEAKDRIAHPGKWAVLDARAAAAAHTATPIPTTGMPRDVNLSPPSAPSAPLLNLAPAQQPTTAMLERIAKDRAAGITKYEDYLGVHGYAIPKVLPAPAGTLVAPTSKSVTVKRDERGRVTQLIKE